MESVAGVAFCESWMGRVSVCPWQGCGWGVDRTGPVPEGVQGPVSGAFAPSPWPDNPIMESVSPIMEMAHLGRFGAFSGGTFPACFRASQS